MRKKSVIIVAGGTGKRMGTEVPKQFLLLKQKPILFYSLETFHAFDPNIQIILVIPETHFNYWKSLCKEHHLDIPLVLEKGGEVRFESVKNGLKRVPDGLVAIHDGARPLIDRQTILNLFSEAEKKGNAVPVQPVNESVREITEQGNHTVDRSKLYLVQTPQIFRSEDLHKAYKQDFRDFFTDDASVVETLGIKINLVETTSPNIKITRPEDLKIAETLL